MNATQPLLLKLLLEWEAVDEEQLRDLPKHMAQHPDSLEEALVQGEIVSAHTIAAAYSSYLSIPMIDDDDDLVERCSKLADIVPETVCRGRRLIVVGREDDVLDVACVSPLDLGALEEVQLAAGLMTRPNAIALDLFEEVVGKVYGARDVVREIASEEAAGPGEADLDEGGAQVVVDLDRPVPKGKEGQTIRIVNFILHNAIKEGASDIHLEPYEEQVRVRYRIDGQLIETTPPPRALWVPTISRLKVLSKMDIAERRVPQDGAISLKVGEARVDLRVSTVPTVFGEKMVLRILAKEETPDNLQVLGFSDRQAQEFVAAADSPHGLVFVTGPTGSGKSTTLYTCLSMINKPNINIATVEDPVEYRYYGLNQCHVRSNVGMTFAKALRAFLRQDPDVIMVGEVRDQETGMICLRAALTGHLVLSTLHTNSSLQAINRLVDMGVEPFLLGPALRLVEAQRLARTLCIECKEPYDLPADVARKYQMEAGIKVYRPPSNNSCTRCRGTGYKGRVGMFEVVKVTDDLRDLIMANAPLPKLRACAKATGVTFLDDSARDKIAAGLTSFEEVADYFQPVEGDED